MSLNDAIEEAREALKVFAEVATELYDDADDETFLEDPAFTFGDLRRASRALAALNEVAVGGLTEEERAAIQKDVSRIQMELDFAAARGVGHPASGDIRTLLRHIERLLSPAPSAKGQ